MQETTKIWIIILGVFCGLLMEKLCVNNMGKIDFDARILSWWEIAILAYTGIMAIINTINALGYNILRS